MKLTVLSIISYRTKSNNASVSHVSLPQIVDLDWLESERALYLLNATLVRPSNIGLRC